MQLHFGYKFRQVALPPKKNTANRNKLVNKDSFTKLICDKQTRHIEDAEKEKHPQTMNQRAQGRRYY